MSFMDIINEEQKKLEQGNNNEKVKYPETKHKRLFYAKDQRELLIQVLPAANIVGAFAVPARKIFLSAKSSQGKDLNSNFTLDAEPNEGSYLEQKIAEWSEKGLIPNGFGGQQTPKRVFLVNAVKIVPNPAQPGSFMQERDENGKLAVRVFEMPQSAYTNYLRKLVDPMLNTSGTDLSFMDPNKPATVKISKPAKGQMEYPVDVYTNVPLPPLGQGWENELENLSEQAVPTERLENGQDWVNAFVDMKEGRKPQRKGEEQKSQPQSNPYADQQSQPTQQNTYAQPNQQQQNPLDPFASQQNQQPQQTQQNTLADPFASQQNQQPQQNTPADPFANPSPSQSPVVDDDPFAGSQLSDSYNAAPEQNYTQVPHQQQNTQTPSHNVDVNSNGLMDIDAMLDAELKGM